MNALNMCRPWLGTGLFTRPHLFPVILLLGCVWCFGPPKTLAAETLAAANGDIAIHPVHHASLVLQWNGQAIYVDPVGGGGKYAAFPKADWVLITHEHGDHLDRATLEAVVQEKTVIVAPAAVGRLLPENLRKQARILANGQTEKPAGFTIEAIPAYNLAPEKTKYHAKGNGNGYVLTLGGKRLYLSGDTEDIPEMRALTGIDAAFVCMNLPYTMTVDQAVSAVRAFKPKVVYPYHSRGTDVARFKKEVEASPDIAVRLLAWYP